MEQAQVNLGVHSHSKGGEPAGIVTAQKLTLLAGFLKLATFSVFHIVAVTILLNFLDYI